MSWKDKQATDFIVVTGDGKQYTMTWRLGSKSTAYNIAQFEFNEVAGSLVVRGTPKGRTFPLELVCQGENHLDDAATFEASANDKRPWTVQHPQYGTIVVQPSDITFDNTIDNVTRITCNTIETIGTDAVNIVQDAPTKIADDKVLTDEAFANTLAEDMPVKKVSNIKALQKNIDGIFANVSKKIADSTDSSAFFNKYNEANALINNTVWDALAVNQQIQNLISMPANFLNTLVERVEMFKLQFAFLIGGTGVITTRDGKKIFENNAGTVITGLILASVTNITGGYRTKKDVLQVIDSVVGMYNTYITTLDSLQTDNGGNPESYIPDPDSLTRLTALTSYAVSNLLLIAQDSRQERRIYLENDSDPVQLAFRFYGLKVDDSTINEFIDTNSLLREELFEVKKGREIVYYV